MNNSIDGITKGVVEVAERLDTTLKCAAILLGGKPWEETRSSLSNGCPGT